MIGDLQAALAQFAAVTDAKQRPGFQWSRWEASDIDPKPPGQMSGANESNRRCTETLTS